MCLVLSFLTRFLVDRNSNIRVTADSIDFDKHWDCGPDNCLEDDFRLASSFFSGGMKKVLTLLASYPTRQDDERMEVFKLNDDGKFMRRFLTVHERCNLMGYPDGYIVKPLTILYSKLCYAHKFL
jgi:hypothetical protein